MEGMVDSPWKTNRAGIYLLYFFVKSVVYFHVNGDAAAGRRNAAAEDSWLKGLEKEFQKGGL